jgi:hypothetical protein
MFRQVKRKMYVACHLPRNGFMDILGHQEESVCVSWRGCVKQRNTTIIDDRLEFRTTREGFRNSGNVIAVTAGHSDYGYGFISKFIP